MEESATINTYATAMGIGADAHGDYSLALAAIQGLNQKLGEQRPENAALKARLQKLESLPAKQLLAH